MPPPSSTRLPTPAEIVADLDRNVHGQAAAKRTLARAVYKHFLGLAQSEFDQDGRTVPKFGRQNVLLTGPTGSGKTFLVRNLADALGVPIAFCNATTLVEAGFVGQQVESTVRALLTAAKGNVARAQRGIVFVDEIDKIRRAAGSNHRDISGEGVQNALLPLLEGAVVRVGQSDSQVDIDTSSVLFLCAGAFVGLDEIAERRAGTAGGEIGFGLPGRGPDPRSAPAKPGARSPRRAAPPQRPEISTEDFVTFGMIPEFVGRFADVAHLEPLAPADLAGILTSTEGSILRRAERFAEVHGAELRVDAAAVRALAERGAALRTGARSLDRMLTEALAEVEWEFLDPGTKRPVRRVVVTEAVIREGARPRFVRYKIGQNPPGRSTLEAMRHWHEHRGRGPRKNPRLGRIELPVVRGDAPTDGSDTAEPGASRGAKRRRSARATTPDPASIEDLTRRLLAARTGMDFQRATPAARDWWNAFERFNERGRLPSLVEVAESLVGRALTLEELFAASRRVNQDDPRRTLEALDSEAPRRDDRDLPDDEAPRTPPGREPSLFDDSLDDPLDDSSGDQLDDLPEEEIPF